MASMIKQSTELSEDEIQRLYEIYVHAYGNKGIQMAPRNDWKKHVREPYCYSGRPRIVQSFKSPDDAEGYLIFTEPTPYENRKASKIIQAGIHAHNSIISIRAYIEMIAELLTENKGVEFLVEDGNDMGSRTLYCLAGFKRIRTREVAERLLTTLVPSQPHDFLEDSSGLLLRRNTRFKKGCLSALLTNYA